MQDPFLFQYCQKLVIFSSDYEQLLLCKRATEADYDEVFSFIGGKMVTTDSSVVAGLKREKDEEIGKNCLIRVASEYSTNILFRKSDGHSMILPHYLAVYVGGDIALNDEYSEYTWVKLGEIDTFEPKIPTIPKVIKDLLRIKPLLQDEDFVPI